MKISFKILTTFMLLAQSIRYAQYTDVINSNRPGASVSAFAVGTKVLQAELGVGYEKQDHYYWRANTNILSTDVSLRYGLLWEQLEVSWDGTYLFDKLTNNVFTPPTVTKRNGFLSNTLGVKYLVFDPFKNPETNKPNLYSWKANHTFNWRNLLPAVAVYAGANINLLDSPYAYNDLFLGTLPNINEPLYEPTFSYKAMLITQNHIAGTWVFVTNITYDKIGTDYPELSYILTLTHALANPKWSVFGEMQGIKSTAYADYFVRGGAAYLVSKHLQVDASAGVNFKDTPSRLFGAVGVSYRVDRHEDENILSVKQQQDEEKENADEEILDNN